MTIREAVKVEAGGWPGVDGAGHGVCEVITVSVGMRNMGVGCGTAEVAAMPKVMLCMGDGTKLLWPGNAGDTPVRSGGWLEKFMVGV